MHMDFAVGEHVARGALVGVLGLWCPGCEGFDVLPTRDRSHFCPNFTTYRFAAASSLAPMITAAFIGSWWILKALQINP
ncbi:hypothetical protein LAC80_35840 (plasmid) [Ensifer adhaerens]|uniref:hypothetical protein n=1 Tax=Ensifer adhaerens TaxID=106592 RepID=UPI001CBB053E|nr:hypothetical protein [Ensifer adhaerens]UAX98325.1 hypothetical protein LAC78_37135 [Ensifer adhaerens]UAY05708.1 hypothetical protein LAC80_35840 [Ensifer adhaerens]